MSTNDKYPVELSVPYPGAQSKLLAILSIPFFLARAVLLIPVFVILYVLGFIAFVAAWIGMWGIAFTGKYPQSLHEFVSGVVRWQARMNAYLLGLTDKYPPFRLSP